MSANCLVCYAPAIGISSTTPSRILNFHDNEPQEMTRIVPFLFVKVKYDRTLEQISNVVSSKLLDHATGRLGRTQRSFTDITEIMAVAISVINSWWLVSKTLTTLTLGISERISGIVSLFASIASYHGATGNYYLDRKPRTNQILVKRHVHAFTILPSLFTTIVIHARTRNGRRR